MLMTDFDKLKKDAMTWKKPKYDGRCYGFGIENSWIDEPLSNTAMSRTMIDELVKHFRKIETEKENKMIIQNSYVCINGEKYKANDVKVNHFSDPMHDPEIEVRAFLCPGNKITDKVSATKSKIVKAAPIVDIPGIKNVIFSYPATIVFWTDGTKTIVKCKPGDQWDPHAGISAAISKKFFGTQVNKWVKKAEYAKVPPVDGGDE